MTPPSTPAWEQVPHGWPSLDVPDVDRLVAAASWAATDVGAHALAVSAASTPAPAAVAAAQWRTEPSQGPTDLACAALAGHQLTLAAALAYTDHAAVHRAARAVPADQTLLLATGSTLLAMEQLLFTTQDILRSAADDPDGVSAVRTDEVAHLLCARIRPDLFPPSCATPRAPQLSWLTTRAALGAGSVLGSLAAVSLPATVPSLPDVALLTWAADTRTPAHPAMTKAGPLTGR